MNENSTTLTMTDVDLTRDWDGATISLTIVNGDDDELDNLLHQGYRVTGIVTVL